MNWKEFKNKYNADNIDESKFVIGIDIGNETSSISYFDFNRKNVEVIDISGGYGKASIPTIIQYIKDTKEWVFGEYALLNKGMADEITFNNVIRNIGKKAYYEIGEKALSLSHILALFIKEIMNNIKNINPNAEIVGIVASLPCYITEDAKTEFYNAFKIAGFEKELIEIKSNRECLIQYCYDKDKNNENALIIDFGGQEIRGGIYKIIQNTNVIDAKCIATYFDDTAGTQSIEKSVLELFKKYYVEETKSEVIDSQTQFQLESFVYQQKDLLFQRKQNKDFFKVYFNFVYPPFQKIITREDIENLISPFYKKLNDFLYKLFETSIEKIQFRDIDRIICTGGGFEMVWVKDFIENIFDKSKILFFKNPKSVISKGACIYACSRLNIINHNEVKIIDQHQLKSDIGLMITENNRERFISIIEKNSFWWKKHQRKLFIINQEVNSKLEVPLFNRNDKGEINLIKTIEIEELPKRPKGTTQISIELEYKSFEKLVANVEDFGFGEIFPKSNYKKSFTIYDTNESVGENDFELGRI